MKHILIFVLLISFGSIYCLTIPRSYLQKLVLDDGSLPEITWDGKISAPEYRFSARILENEDDSLSTDVDNIHCVAIKRIGDGTKIPYMVIASVQLGNFKHQWQAEQTLHLELTHLATGKKIMWDILIPKGTNVMKYLDPPVVIPPSKKKSCCTQ